MKWLMYVVLGLTLAGCFGVPPLRMTAGVGGAAGDVAVHPHSEQRTVEASARLGELRLGFTPLTLLPGRLDRRFDVAVGAMLGAIDTPREGPVPYYGPHLDLTWFALVGAPSDTFRWRLGPTLHGELPMMRSGERTVGGTGASIGVLYEIATPEDVDNPVATAHGEYGVGVSLQVGVRNVDEGTYGFAMLAVEARIPGMIGFAIPRGSTNNGVFQ